jgi:hypothetical protein
VDPKVSADQRGHGIGVALDVYTKSSMKDRAIAAKQLEDSVFTKAVRGAKEVRVILNGGLWRVRFWSGCKLLILERETGLEPATSSLGI